MPPKQKLYCYVDETGQDPTSDVFIVVAIVKAGDQEKLQQALTEIEKEAGTRSQKWHRLRPENRLNYLNLVLDRKICDGDVFFSVFEKPLQYFQPFVTVLDRAIQINSTPPYTARIFVDGIDRRKAAELTMALRQRGISLRMARARRDESEPLVRLADMWAGCIRAALHNVSEEKKLLNQAIAIGHLQILDSES